MRIRSNLRSTGNRYPSGIINYEPRDHLLAVKIYSKETQHIRPFYIMMSSNMDQSKFQTLAGKIAIVTGASRSIGAGIALELAQRGAQVSLRLFRDLVGGREKPHFFLGSLNIYAVQKRCPSARHSRPDQGSRQRQFSDRN